MDKAKYLTYTILIFIAFAFVGELSAWNIHGFEYRYMSTSFYLQQGQVQEDMVNDIEREAKAHNLDIFVVDAKVVNARHETVDIYGTSNVESDVNKRAKINAGSYDSIILGTSTVKFHKFKDIPDVNDFEEYYIIGSYEDAYKFKQKTIGLYAGGFPHEFDYIDEMTFYISSIWVILFALILILNLYSISLKKKEIMLRIISGDSLKDIVFKRIGCDTIIYIAVFAIALFSLKPFSNSDFRLQLSVGIFSVFLVLNALLNMSLFRTNFKSNIMTNRSGKAILRISYIYKLITMLLVIIMMSTCIQLINFGLQWYLQKDFYEDHKEYSFVNISTPYSEEDDWEIHDAEIQYKFYSSMVQNGKGIGLIDEGDYGESLEHMYANNNAVPYLKERINELNNIEFEEKIYMIFPEKYRDDQETISLIRERLVSSMSSQIDEKIIYYQGRTRVMGIRYWKEDMEDYSTLMRNPIIILDNTDGVAFKFDNDEYNAFNQATMFDISEGELNAFIKENKIEEGLNYKTSVLDAYNEHWKMLQRGMIIGLAILAIILMLEIIIISTIIKYEFSINSVNLTLKRILGYNVFERHAGIIKLTLIAGIFTTIVAVFVLTYLGFEGKIYVLIGGLSVTALELIFILFNIKKFEKSNIQKILKGGTM